MSPHRLKHLSAGVALALALMAASPLAHAQVTAQSSSALQNLALPMPITRSFHLTLDQRYPNSVVTRGTGAPSPLPAAPMDLDTIVVKGDDGKSMRFADWQRQTVTDGLLVLHRGQVVYEKYAGGLTATQRHATWSVTKSLTGLIATDLIQAGTIDPNAPIGHYVPELRDSAWGDATVQQVLDMRTGVRYDENPLELVSGIRHFIGAAGLSPVLPVFPLHPRPRTIMDFLKTRQKSGEHGQDFRYKTPDSQVIAQVLVKVTGKDLATLFSERIWAPMGAERDAFLLKDRGGTHLSGSGLASTLRDLARFGEMVRLEGRFNDKQILQPGTVAEIRKGEAQGYDHHNSWWMTHDADGSFEARGFSGQYVHVNPAAELVIVKLSTNVFAEFTPIQAVPDRNAFAAIAQALRGR